MRLRDLLVDRMPGFESGGFSITGMGPGLNVVVGPNGSGKSTACRAIRSLFWPESLPPMSRVRGGLDDAQGHLVAEIDSNRRLYERDGVTVDAPRVPPNHLAECFALTLDDLFASKDQELASQVSREMAGGYDVPALGRQKQFRKINPAQMKPVTDYWHADQEVQKRQKKQAVLLDRLEGLPHQRRQLDEARLARQRIVVLKAALCVRKTEEELAGHECELESRDFPPNMDCFREDDLDLIVSLRERERLASEKLQRAQADARVADAKKTNLGLDDLESAERQHNEITARTEKFRSLDSEVARLEREEGEAERRLERLGGVLRALDANEHSRPVDAALLDEAAQLLRLQESQNQRDEHLKRMRSRAQESNNGVGRAPLEDGIRALQEWLEHVAAREASEHMVSRIRRLCFVLFLVSTAAGIWALLLGDAGWVPIFIVLPGLGASLWGLVVFRSGDTGEEAAETIRRLCLEEPREWSPPGVREHLRQLSHRLTEALEKELRIQASRKELEDTKHVEEEGQKLLEAWMSLGDRLGVSEVRSGLTLTRLAEVLVKQDQMKQQLAGVRGSLERGRGQWEGELDSLNRLLQLHGYPGCRDLPELVEAHGNLHRRIADRHVVDGELSFAQERQKGARDDLTGIRADLRRLASRIGALEALEKAALGLAIDAVEDLVAPAVPVLPEYRNISEKIREAKVRLDVHRLQVTDAPDLPAADLLEMSLPAIEQRFDEERIRGDGCEKLQRDVLKVETEVNEAKSRRDLERDLADRERARGDLRDLLKTHLVAEAGRFFLEEVEREHHQRQRPAVLKQAQSWFARFTHGEWRLEMAAAETASTPAFVALESSTGRKRALDQLSRGTRIQLLLAVRMAFVDYAGLEDPLPVVMDEPLGTSDPARFTEVAGCILEMVRAGRQVIYFTCRPEEAEAWSRLAGSEAVRHFDLAAIRRLEQRVMTPFQTTPLELFIPEPGDQDWEDYAVQLGVPGINFSRSVNENHIAHLTRDPQTLHRLLKAGVRTIGQWRILVQERAAGTVLLDATVHEGLEVRGRVLEVLMESWTVGRGKRLDQEALVASGVTKNFMAQVVDLARTVDWEADRLIEQLIAKAVPGFRKAAIESMQTYFLEHGYLKEQSPLTPEEAYARVLRAAAPYLHDGRLSAEEVELIFRQYWPAQPSDETVL